MFWAGGTFLRVLIPPYGLQGITPRGAHAPLASLEFVKRELRKEMERALFAVPQRWVLSAPRPAPDPWAKPGDMFPQHTGKDTAMQFHGY